MTAEKQTIGSDLFALPENSTMDPETLMLVGRLAEKVDGIEFQLADIHEHVDKLCVVFDKITKTLESNSEQLAAITGLVAMGKGLQFVRTFVVFWGPLLTVIGLAATWLWKHVRIGT